MSFGFSFVGAIALFGALLGPAGGGLSNDLTALISADAYFQSRNLPTQPEKVIALAGKAPADAAGRFAQLMAIRWLEDNADKLGDHKKAARAALKVLAEGPQGFARDFALRAAARLDGQPLPMLHTLVKDGLRSALDAFPEDVHLVVAVDLRPPAGYQLAAGQEPPLARELNIIRSQWQQKILPPQALEEIMKFADAVGNVRIDRFTVAFDVNADNGRIFLRVQGAADGKRLVDFLRGQIAAEVTEEKGPKGETITLLNHKGPPAIAVIGDTELLVAGYQRDKGDHASLLRAMLDVRAGKKNSVLKSPLAKLLASVPEDASALVAGTLPDSLRQELANSPLGVVPKQVVLSVSQQPGKNGVGLTVRLRGTMDREPDARPFVDGVNTLKLMAVKALDDLGIKPELSGVLKKTVQAAAIKVDGATVLGEAKISAEAVQAAVKLLTELVMKEIRP